MMKEEEVLKVEKNHEEGPKEYVEAFQFKQLENRVIAL